MKNPTWAIALALLLVFAYTLVIIDIITFLIN
jgi:hypothetical protein